MKKTLFSLFLFVAAAASFGFMAADVITVKGSDTMVIMAQKWAEAYHAKNPGVEIRVTGGGSGTGISALINGTTDICNASRPMTAAEKAQLKSRYGSPGVEVRTALDGITIYLNPSNPVKELSMAQLKDMFTGRISNWKQVGGNDARIILYGRENSSGTYGFFKENVLKGQDFASGTQTLPGTAAVVNAVLKDKNGVGYGGYGYTKGVHVCAVKATDGGAAITPSDQSVRSGQYPISRFLYLYLRNRPTGALKAYVDWILSAEGQAIVKKAGYFPLK
ncbi:MAG TPA: phosphate ABC transporter substrate-binding protein [Candidatus Kapabacteria bacterium]|nr:phosphate ABC transporter substrate-binding protein [Candidatus Kapabacteria bacterium]